jgi:DNA replication and repair protein RecF
VSLESLSVDHLRCLEHAVLDLHPGHNLIWGANASGKTSLLEAIFLLGRGRSFRTRNSDRLIQHSANQLIAIGRTAAVLPQTLGVQVSRNEGTVAKINGAFVKSLAELSRAFAVQVIEPGIHRLVEESGQRRRRWLDWAVFHVEPGFIDVWSSYVRTLKQRNAALRAQSDYASAWEPELARLGEIISASRRSLIDRLRPYWAQAIASLVGGEIELGYARGWPQDLSLSEALAAARDRDAARGITHSGPHRADVIVRTEGKPARDVLSRGQQKLVAIAMTLSQLHLIRDATGTTPTLLLDDPAAELDRERLERFTEQITQLRTQLIVTALSADLDPLGAPNRTFHVEQGRVEPV